MSNENGTVLSRRDFGRLSAAALASPLLGPVISAATASEPVAISSFSRSAMRARAQMLAIASCSRSRVLTVRGISVG